MAVNENKDFYDFNNYVTKLKKINKPETIAILNNYSVFHSLTKTNVFNLSAEPLVFTFNSRYFSKTFQGIMPDSGAARVSTAGQP
jgi:UDP-galactopyranose mutase